MNTPNTPVFAHQNHIKADVAELSLYRY